MIEHVFACRVEEKGLLAEVPTGTAGVRECVSKSRGSSTGCVAA